MIVLRLVAEHLDGIWMQVAEGRNVSYLVADGATTTMVATGSVEWDGDRCAEVYVPQSRLGEWLAEHVVD